MSCRDVPAWLRRLNEMKLSNSCSLAILSFDVFVSWLGIMWMLAAG